MEPPSDPDTADPDIAAAEVFDPLADRCLIIAGPTASGKSDLACAVAEAIDGEIISLDAFAVYREMNIGTAKPSPSQRQRIGHHLIDVVDPDREFSVAEYLRLTHDAVRKITERGRVPVIAGGTPMYLRGVLRGFDPGPPADPRFRAAAQADAERYGCEAMHQRLRQVDPLSAMRIDRTDVRRMIRALEVSFLTGQPISHRQTQHHRSLPKSMTAAFHLSWQRSRLHDRINRRTKEMFERGLIDEVRDLMKRYRLSRTAAAAVGYREVIGLFSDTDDPSTRQIEDCQSVVAAHTRQLARRQETWFRSFEELRSIDGDANTRDQVAEIVEVWRGRDAG